MRTLAAQWGTIDVLPNQLPIQVLLRPPSDLRIIDAILEVKKNGSYHLILAYQVLIHDFYHHPS